MRKGYYAMKAILDSNMASTQLATVLKLLLDDFDKDVFTDRSGWVYIYLKDTQSTYPMLKKIETLIEEAVQIAIKLGMEKEVFEPVGRALDAI